MTKLPNINQFLDEVDPQGSLDKERVIADLTAVSLILAAKDAKENLDSDSANSLDELLNKKEDVDVKQLYSIFEKAGKKDSYLAQVEKSTNKVRLEYMKSHLQEMSEDQRTKIISKYPSFSKIIS